MARVASMAEPYRWTGFAASGWRVCFVQGGLAALRISVCADPVGVLTRVQQPPQHAVVEVAEALGNPAEMFEGGR